MKRNSYRNSSYKLIHRKKTYSQAPMASHILFPNPIFSIHVHPRLHK